jgi:hypothetical protein
MVHERDNFIVFALRPFAAVDGLLRKKAKNQKTKMMRLWAIKKESEWMKDWAEKTHRVDVGMPSLSALLRSTGRDKGGNVLPITSSVLFDHTTE